MLAKSHMLSAMIVAVPILGNIEQEYAIMFLLATLIGSLFPDLDEPGSFLSRRVQIISILISLFTTHRGITHTIAIVLVYALVGSYFVFEYDSAKYVLFGFIIGNIIHLMGDMATKSGVKIFYPLTNKSFHLLPKSMRLYTNGKVEIFVVIPMFILILVFELYILGKGQYQGLIL